MMKVSWYLRRMALVAVYIYAVGGRNRRGARLSFADQRAVKELSEKRPGRWAGSAPEPTRTNYVTTSHPGGVVGVCFLKQGENFSIARPHAGKADISFWRQYHNSRAKPTQQDLFDVFEIAEAYQLDGEPLQMFGTAPNVKIQALREDHVHTLKSRQYWKPGRNDSIPSEHIFQREGVRFENFAVRLPLEVATAAVTGVLNHVCVCSRTPSSEHLRDGSSWTGFRKALGPDAAPRQRKPAGFAIGPKESVGRQIHQAMDLVRGTLNSGVIDTQSVPGRNLNDALETLDEAKRAMRVRVQKDSARSFKRDVLKDLVLLVKEIKGVSRTETVVRKVCKQIFEDDGYCNEVVSSLMEESKIASRWTVDRARVRMDCILNLVDRERCLSRDEFVYWMLADASPKIIELMNCIVKGMDAQQILEERPDLIQWLASPVGLGSGRLGLDAKIHSVLHQLMLFAGADCRRGRSALFEAMSKFALKVRAWTTDKGVEKGIVDTPMVAIEEYIDSIGPWGGEEKGAIMQMDEVLDDDADAVVDEETLHGEPPPEARPVGLMDPSLFLYRRAMWVPGLKHIAHNAAKEALKLLFTLWIGFKHSLRCVASVFGRHSAGVIHGRLLSA